MTIPRSSIRALRVFLVLSIECNAENFAHFVIKAAAIPLGAVLPYANNFRLDFAYL
ncbi:MAG: hypothetical protein ABR928_02415 [Terracidiphilus sp.]|jgi:hypothetical protein